MKLLLTIFAVLLAAAGAANAAPIFCPGTVTTVTSGQSLPGSFFLTGAGTSTGNCAEAADKFIGGFSIAGSITGAGSSVFTFQMPADNVQLGVQGSIGPSTTGTINYSVQIDPLLSHGLLMDDLGKDFTLGADNVVGPASATLTGHTTASAFNFDCVRTVNPESSTCPQDASFAPVSQMAVTETLTTGTNAVVTGITDTISQTAVVPEPASLAMLGSGLLMLGMVAWRRRQH